MQHVKSFFNSYAQKRFFPLVNADTPVHFIVRGRLPEEYAFEMKTRRQNVRAVARADGARSSRPSCQGLTAET